MLCSCIVVIILSSLVLGQAVSLTRVLPLRDDPLPAHTPISFNVSNFEGIIRNDEVVGTCLFGDSPSAFCRFSCFWRGKSSHCDQESNCFCREEEVLKPLISHPGHGFGDKDSATTTEPAVSFVFPETYRSLAGFCFYDAPSAICKLRCYMREKSAVCDERRNCWCQNSDDKGNENRTDHATLGLHNTVSDQDVAETDAEDTKPAFILYIIHLFNPDNETITYNTDTGTVISKDSPSSIQEGWSIPHILAVFILIVFIVLVTLECLLLCTRRRSFTKQNFQTVCTIPTVEKVLVNGKQ